MTEKYLLCFLGFVLISGQSVSQLYRCACSEYPAAICTFTDYCTWTGTQCVDLICSTLPNDICDAKSTEYKCIWNEQQNICEEHQYNCQEIAYDECPYQEYGLNCITDEQAQSCVDFNCNDVSDVYYCDPQKCSYINDKCGDPVNQDCSALSTCDGSQFNGDGKICYTNDLNVCKQYNSKPQNCSEYNDSSDLCNNHSCTYDDVNKICQQTSCSSIYVQTLCFTIEDDINQLRYICQWNGDQCINVSPQQQIQNFKILQCIEQPGEYCTWDLQAQYCKECVNFSLNRKYQQLDNQKLIFLMIYLFII